MDERSAVSLFLIFERIICREGPTAASSLCVYHLVIVSVDAVTPGGRIQPCEDRPAVTAARRWCARQGQGVRSIPRNIFLVTNSNGHQHVYFFGRRGRRGFLLFSCWIINWIRGELWCHSQQVSGGREGQFGLVVTGGVTVVLMWRWGSTARREF